MIRPSQALIKYGKRREEKTPDWWRNRKMTEDGKGVFHHAVPVYIHLLRESNIHLLV